MTVSEAKASLCWYVLHTNANQEGRAEDNLRTLNIEVFVPRCQHRHKNQFGSQPRYFIKALFPRYIFARFNADERLHKVRFTRGVHSVVSIGGRPARVEDELIALIKSRTDSNGFIKLEDNIKSGDEVLVRGGHFNGLVGVFERRMKDSERVTILLKTVTYPIRVIIPEANVTKLTV